MRKVPVVSLHVNPGGVLNIEKTGRHSGNYETLIENVRQLITDKSLKERMASDAMQYAFENHSIENADKLIRLQES